MKKLIYLLFCLITGIGLVSAQTTRITGTVFADEDGEPVIGASVVVKGATGTGTITDIDGGFTLTVPTNATTLIVSYIGMLTQEVTISPTMRILLLSDTRQLDEVVVTALGISRERKSLGYAVQEVKGEALSMAKDPNLLKSVAGKVSGVNITSTTGALGASARIQIRGISSFSGSNQPLFVVDGTPITNERLSYNDVDFGNNASEIDPEAIESMSILKGPSATALYGSRALNGVVLITTKQGQLGRKSANISFSSSLTFDKVSTMPKYQNMYGQGYFGSEFEYQQYKDDGGPLSYQDYINTYSYRYVDGRGSGVYDDEDVSWGGRLDAGLLVDQFHGKNQPWISHPNNIRDIFETAVGFTNSLTVNAASENVAGRITYTNDQLTGVLPNTGLKRNNINGNIVIDFGKYVKADLNITYHNEYSDNLPTGGYTSGNPMQMAGWFGRQVDTKILKENWNTFFEETGYPYNWISIYHNNPWLTANKIIKENDKDRVFGNFGLEFSLTNNLKLITRLGYDNYTYDTRAKWSSLDIEEWDNGTNGRFEWNTGRRSELNMDAMLRFNQNFGDINIAAMAGANFREYKSRFGRLTAPALVIPDFFSISNVRGNPTYALSTNWRRTNSVFGSVNIGYKNWLYLDATARNDWTSALSPDNWSYFYPSVGLGLIFTDALRLESNILSYGKLRASWAQVGSDTDAYALTRTYSSYVTIHGYNQSAYTGTLPDPLLQPQRKTSVELGTDLRFLNNRISLDFTWYQDKTKNQIMDVPVSYASGYSTTRINAGVIQNTGIEIMLSGKILENPRGLNWTSTVNWSTNKSKILELYGDMKSLNIGNSWGMVYIRGYVGDKVGDMYTYIRQKDPATGKYLTDDGVWITSDDMEKVGNTMPDWIAGWNNEFHYKNLNLSFLLNGKIGGVLFPMTAWFGLYSGVLDVTTANGIRENGMVVDGIDVNTGQPNTTRVSAFDLYYERTWDMPEMAVMDASFIKLQEIVFGYSFPESLMRQTGFIKGANLSFVARNVALLYVNNKFGIDPDTMRGTGLGDIGQEDYSAPPVRSLGFKLTLNF